MRWLVPVFFFAATAWVAQTNRQSPNAQIIFPFVDAIFPETKGDMAAMGEKSVVLLFGLSVGVALLTVADQLRAWARRREAEDA